ncbi:N(2)-fixation sustaining protein CowN [Propionivibrio limicola]|uniref:N(2)-fixation sustaining protein CowN n=1 Tax=Propionivibrio limicola TaxID=167645 RepID=UPI001290DC73|nr:N(2)-fixation sustaining protein CowN [Propionivibrio limicola]
MSCSCQQKTDRYKTFDGIDCDGNARKVMELIEKNMQLVEHDLPFWTYFMKKRQPRSGPKPDDLFLIHCHINQVRDLFDKTGDKEAQGLLVQLEEECC